LEFDEAHAPEVSTPFEKQREYSQSARPWPGGVWRPGVPEDGLDKRSRSQDAFVRGPVLASSPERGHRMPAAGTPAQSAPLKLGPASLGYAAREKLTVVPACGSPRCPEAAQDLCGCLPRPVHMSEERAVSAPSILIQSRQPLDNPRPQGIQVNVADQLQKVGFPLAEDRLEAVLKQLAAALVPPVELHGIAGKHALQHLAFPETTSRWRWFGNSAQA
jgi:hypothetical protein